MNQLQITSQGDDKLYIAMKHFFVGPHYVRRWDDYIGIPTPKKGEYVLVWVVWDGQPKFIVTPEGEIPSYDIRMLLTVVGRHWSMNTPMRVNQVGRRIRFDGKWEAFLHKKMPQQEWIAFDVSDFIPWRYTNLTYWRPEVGRLPGTGSGYCQLSFAMDAHSSDAYGALCKGWSRDTEKEVVHDSLPVDFKMGQRNIWLRGYFAHVNLLCTGYDVVEPMGD